MIALLRPVLNFILSNLCYFIELRSVVALYANAHVCPASCSVINSPPVSTSLDVPIHCAPVSFGHVTSDHLPRKSSSLRKAEVEFHKFQRGIMRLLANGPA